MQRQRSGALARLVAAWRTTYRGLRQRPPDWLSSSTLAQSEFDSQTLARSRAICRSVGNGPAVRFGASRCLLHRHNREAEKRLMQRQRSSGLARVFAAWRTGLPMPAPEPPDARAPAYRLPAGSQR